MVGSVGSVTGVVGIGGGLKVQRAVVLSSFRRRAERGVGVGDGDEAGAGFWVVGVPVWVVGFGEGVEGFLHLSRCSTWRYM